MYERAFEQLPMSMALLDEQARILAVNERWRAFARDNGGDPDGYVGGNYLAACGDPDSGETGAIARAFAELVEGERTLVEQEYPCHSPDRRRWFLLQAYRFADGGESRIAVLHLDITERRIAEEALREEVRRDPLTGLLNRASFTERADQVLAIAARRGTSAAVIFLDLDGFKPINDNYGHEVGDRLLKSIAVRLAPHIRDTDALARYGGDELVIVAADAGPDGARRLAERLADTLAEPVDIDGHVLRPACSQGIAVYPDHGPDARTLINAADEAMYEAKARDGGSIALATNPAARGAGPAPG